MSDNREKPFKVRTQDGTLVAEYESEKQAGASAEQRNSRAEALGISTRYVTAEER